jgi:cation diffusion facilitator CzcD-associated flavoprotein CzcO
MARLEGLEQYGMAKTQQETLSNAARSPERFDAVVVGAGLAGLYMLYRLRELGLSTRVYEAGNDVGGTWYWNRYPGARCDTESVDYSFSFSEELQQEWEWSERFATQPEILRYINHVADRFNLRRDIRLKTRVNAAHWDDDMRCWRVETDAGDLVFTRFLVMATGCLSAAQVPDIPGLDRFEGSWYHTGDWPHDGVDFSGQRVGVIGTGSSGIQSIPIIAKQAAHLYVFQRTANYSIPARNAPADLEQVRRIKQNYPEYRRIIRDTAKGYLVDTGDKSALEVSPDELRREYERRWTRGGLGFTAAFSDVTVNPRANETAAEFVRSKIREIVENPEVADALAPRDHMIGTKRLCLDTDYYETYNRDNVTLVDLKRTPIVEITPAGIRTSDGGYDVDSIVFATGFDAMTGALLNVDIRGRCGRRLRDRWADGPRSYLGLAIAGFPNLFTITGPGSPSVLTNMIVSIEQHVDWISECIWYLHERGFQVIEAEEDAEDRWVEHANEVAAGTLLLTAKSWWVGANIPGKPLGLMPYAGGIPVYRQRCDEVAANGYKGFRLISGEAE